MTYDAELALAKGKIEGAKKLLQEYFEKEDYNTWLSNKQSEYDSLFKTKDVIVSAVTDNDEVIEEQVAYEYIDDCVSFDEWLKSFDYQKPNVSKLIHDYLLPICKKDKTAKIKNECTANNPVVIQVDFINGESKTITFNGGDSSASAISGAVQLAQVLNETNVSLWDYSNVLHHGIAFEEAMVISSAIAKKWRDDMFKRQNLLAQINNATTIVEVEDIRWI